MTGPGEKVRVVVADDQAAIRTGLVMILESAPDIDVVGEAADGLTAVALARNQRPDVVLMDIRMPGIDGIEATRRLAGDLCEVLVLTTFDLDEYVDSALAAGPPGSCSSPWTPRLCWRRYVRSPAATACWPRRSRGG